MRNAIKINVLFVMALLLSILLFSTCNNDDNLMEKDIPNSIIEEVDKEALLFMLEEEKLARDTYMFLDNQWSINQFSNIQKSEQTHMNAVENLLKQNNIEYNILPVGEFENQKLQSLYNQFIIDGSINKTNALQIGANIEDLDIVDLQEYIDVISSTAIISVFESLQCGSRNHLRSFLLAIENNGNTYTPQYLSQEEYNTIIINNKEQCN